MAKRNRSIVMFTLDRQVDRRILLEADSLRGDGWDVRIIAMPAVSDRNSDPSYVVRIGISATEQSTGDSLILRMNRFACSILPVNGLIIRSVKAFVWRYLRKPESFFTRLFADAVEKYEADIYVAHDLPMIPVAVKAAKQHGGKLVYDSHELFVEQELAKSERAMWEAVEKEHIASFDAVITINPSIANELKKRYQLEHVTIIHNCDLALERQYKPQKKFHTHFNLPDDALVVLFQGGLSKGRNLNSLVEAFTYVQNTNLHLVVLGDGTIISSLQNTARKAGVENKVHFHPAVSQTSLLEYTASADFGIIPYQPTCLNNYYCTPNKLFEFIAAGLPVVATDLPEIKRIVMDNGIGIVGSTKQPKEIAKLLDNFCLDAEKRKSYKRAVLEAGKKINWQNESRILLDLYDELDEFPVK